MPFGDTTGPILLKFLDMLHYEPWPIFQVSSKLVQFCGSYAQKKFPDSLHYLGQML